MSRVEIKIGDLNTRLTFMKLTTEQDSMGQDKQTLATLGTVWGSLYPVRGSEIYELKRLESKVTHKCYVRYRDDIDTTCYIKKGNEVYEIDTPPIDVKGQHKLLEIYCSLYKGKEVIA